MANISIRNLDDSIKEALRRRAAAEHCSMEEFLRRCLAAAAENGGNPAAMALAGHEAAADWPGRLINEQSGEGAGAGHEAKAGAAGAAAPDFSAEPDFTAVPAGPVAARVAAGEAQPVIGQAALAAGALPAGKGAEAPPVALRGKNIVLIIGGSIAAYKALELIRRLRRAGAVVRVIMTAAAQQFITPLAAGAVAGGPVYRHLFAREGEQDCAADWGGGGPGKVGGGEALLMAAGGGQAAPEIGHIQLARQADIVLVSAATASRLAKMAAGQADDLAGAVLLATRAPVVLAPAMNPAMWAHRATQRNLALLRRDGCHIIGPEQGEMAESGESGLGRMSEPAAIISALAALAANLSGSAPGAGALAGRHIIVTSGPTHEALDPVRYLANRSSGKQGHALAAALAARGARVTLISGPVALPDPLYVTTVHVTGAEEMRAAVLAALPADAAIFVAAVADWRPQYVFSDKIKKPKIRVIAGGSHSGQAFAAGQNKGEAAGKGLAVSAGQVTLTLVENPDILAEVGHNAQRPRLVVGFAAETKDLLENAAAKLARKGADWIIANNVATAADGSSIMGGERNHIHILSRSGVEEWPEMPKIQVAARLAAKIAAFFAAPAAE